MPMPFGPLVGFPEIPYSPANPPPGMDYAKYAQNGPPLPPGYEDQPQIDPQTAMSLMQTLIGSMTGQMNDAMGQPGAPMMDMPQQTNPLAAMAATFSASMADQLTGRQQNLAGVQQTLQQQESDRLTVQHENIKTEAANMRQRQLTRLQFLSQINEVKLKMALEVGDQLKAEAALKAAATHDKEMARVKAEQLEAEIQGRIDVKQTPPGVNENTTPDPAKSDQNVLRFMTNIKTILDNKDSWETRGRGWAKGKTHVALKKEHVPHVQTMAATAIQNTADPALQMSGLLYYLETVRDDEGYADFKMPGGARFEGMLKSMLKDNWKKWLKDQGAIAPTEGP